MMKVFSTLALVAALAGLTGCQHITAIAPAKPTAAELTAPVGTTAQTYAQDAAMPIVEFMPLLVSYEKELNLTPAQVQAITEYRKTAMPVRVALQKNLLALRANLRQAILDNAPAAQRDALMQKINHTEMMHMQARNRCADFVRTTLTPEQFAKLVKLYQQKLQQSAQP